MSYDLDENVNSRRRNAHISSVHVGWPAGFILELITRFY
jgi:hypothetical protein